MNKTDSTKACSGAVARDAPTQPPLGDSVVTLVLSGNEKTPAVSCRGLEKCQTIGIRSCAERER
jgi:hypothetical protein